jgi:hypothetical protein
MSKLERGKRAHFSKELGHISQEEFSFCECYNFLLLERPYCTDRYSPYNKLGGYTNRGILLHGFRDRLG